MEGDSPQTGKGLSKIQDEWKRELCANAAGTQTSTSWHYSPGGSNMLKSAVGAGCPTLDSQSFSQSQHIQEATVSQHLKESWGQRHRMSRLRDRCPISKISLGPKDPLGSQDLLRSQTWHWVIPETMNQIHEAEARVRGQCKGRNLKMAED